MEAWLESLLALLALPKFGLSSVFVVAFVSATLLPLGSEPAVFGLVKLNPSLFWPAVLVATAGNTLGGALTWWMGMGAETVYGRVARKPSEARVDGSPKRELPNQESPNPESPQQAWPKRWLERFGAKACLLAWLPVVGDPLCGVAGWLRLPFWPCLAYMAIGKFARYLTMTAFLLWLAPGQYHPQP